MCSRQILRLLLHITYRYDTGNIPVPDATLASLALTLHALETAEAPISGPEPR